MGEDSQQSRRPWARPLLRLMPMRAWLALERELRLAGTRAGNAVLPGRRRARSAWRGARGLKLNLGCGAHVLEGWVNVDAVRRPGVDLAQDLRRPLPLDDGSASLVFSHHVLEHLHYPDEALALLRECRRVLEPDGWLRVVVPDLDFYARSYTDGPEGHARLREMVGVTAPLDTPAEALNQGLRLGEGHLFAYDAETLAGLLRLAGFSRVERSAFRQSGLGPELARDREQPWFQLESLYMEARP